MANWLTRLFERKESQFGAMTVRMTMGQPVWPQRNMEMYAREGYQRNVIANRCIRMVAEGAAAIPFILYKGDKEVETHPLLDLLRRPNPVMDGNALFESVYSFLQVSGNSYIEGVVGIDRKPRELYTLRPDRMKVVPGPYGLPGAYEYTVGGSTRRVPVDFDAGNVPILHLRTFNPLDDWYGMSPLDPAAWSVDAHSAAGAFNKAVLENGAVPSGALMVVQDKNGSKNLDPAVRKRVQEELEARFTGTKNAGRPMVLEGGMEWHSFAYSNKDLQFTDVKRDAAREIATAFGVPPMLLGIPGDNTFANYQEANKTLWRQTIIPLAQRTARGLGNWLLPLFGEAGLELRANIDDLDALADERVAQWERIDASQSLSVNEKREGLGYDPVDGGEVILVNSTQIPLDMAGEIPQGGAEPVDDPQDDPADKPAKKPAQQPKK